ncbi:MAG TPA: hypothetical protein VGG48_08085 [Rhizomicrobium sp.]
MFQLSEPKTKWSTIGLRATIGALVAAILLSLLDGILRGMASEGRLIEGPMTMYYTWCTDLRYLAEQLVYAGIIFFVGAKFFETRSIFTVGFDRMDADKISFKGPDETNTVWIGHRYDSKLEAETVALALESRLKESANTPV